MASGPWRSGVQADDSLAARLRDFNSVDLSVALEISAEDDPHPVRREMNVRFELVVVMVHVHEPLRHQPFALGMEQVEPASILRARDLTRVAAVAAEEPAIGRAVEMDPPLVARHLESQCLACLPIS